MESLVDDLTSIEWRLWLLKTFQAADILRERRSDMRLDRHEIIRCLLNEDRWIEQRFGAYTVELRAINGIMGWWDIQQRHISMYKAGVGPDGKLGPTIPEYSRPTTAYYVRVTV